jgi:hypothetical protein
MTIVTFDRVPATDTAAPAGVGFWTRFLERMIEARQRRALEQIRRYHRFAFPSELDGCLWKADRDPDDSLPFGR